MEIWKCELLPAIDRKWIDLKRNYNFFFHSVFLTIFWRLITFNLYLHVLSALFVLFDFVLFSLLPLWMNLLHLNLVSCFFFPSGCVPYCSATENRIHFNTLIYISLNRSKQKGNNNQTIKQKVNQFDRKCSFYIWIDEISQLKTRNGPTNVLLLTFGSIDKNVFISVAWLTPKKKNPITLHYWIQLLTIDRICIDFWPTQTIDLIFNTTEIPLEIYLLIHQIVD